MNDKGRSASPFSRKLLVRGTRQPVAIYQLNGERGTTIAYSGFIDTANVSVFGCKSEGSGAVLFVRDSTSFASGRPRGREFVLPVAGEPVRRPCAVSVARRVVPPCQLHRHTASERAVDGIEQQKRHGWCSKIRLVVELLIDHRWGRPAGWTWRPATWRPAGGLVLYASVLVWRPMIPARRGINEASTELLYIIQHHSAPFSPSAPSSSDTMPFRHLSSCSNALSCSAAARSASFFLSVSLALACIHETNPCQKVPEE